MGMIPPPAPWSKERFLKDPSGAYRAMYKHYDQQRRFYAIGYIAIFTGLMVMAAIAIMVQWKTY